ncbi:uncharacterized protein LOC131606952 [Vicia villosa]|uniref:uncharacterized protein LOC131606952 n=1 Tax=Vicia villosa TaxID=3911 RepID=UPI00273ADBD5|nr:uncharacterized protein LOC131606952 [Vicia villosa]
MDSLPALPPEKTKDSKPKLKQKRNQATKIGTGSESQTQFRQNRVFGTAWNTNVNIPKKPVSENIITKPKPAIPQKPKQPIQATQVTSETAILTQPTDTKSLENVNLIKIKTSETLPQENDSSEPKTPVTSSRVRGKSKVQATPFYSAVNCSKCRFDRLETSSYWIGQIKLAETVGKHYVACGFFKLALKSQAEPIRNLRIELKRYLSRHGHLYEEKEWKRVAARYGLLKDESITSEMNSTT